MARLALTTSLALAACAVTVAAADRGDAAAVSLRGVSAVEHGHRHLTEGIEYKHKGCFIDRKEERVLWKLMVDDALTPARCHEHCDAISAAYMALQFGRECWCSRQGDLEFDVHGPGEFGECNMLCEGDPEVTCGGYEAFDLYQLEWAEASTSDEYVGCFADMKSDRVMHDLMVMDDMTESTCRAHCSSRDALYYATQFGDECWCGYAFDLVEYEVHGPGVCHMECAGDPSTACGGFEAFSLYTLNTASQGPENDDGTEAETDDGLVVVSPSPASPTPEPTVVSAPTPDPDTSDSGMEVLLQLHNQIRCLHGADPLVWSSALQSAAESYALVLTTPALCGQLRYSTESNDYGETLFMCFGGGGGCYTPEGAMKGFYGNEVETGSVETYGRNAVQILWKSTTEIGCALASCSDFGQETQVLVCHYSPASVFGGLYGDEVEPPSKSAEECANV